MIDQVFAHSHQFSAAEQNLQQGARTRWLDARFRKDLGRGWHRETGFPKQSFDLADRFLLVLLKRYTMRSETDDVAFGCDVLGARKQRVEQERGSASQFPAPQFFLSEARMQWVPPMVVLENVAKLRDLLFGPGTAREPRMRVRKINKFARLADFSDFGSEQTGPRYQIRDTHSVFGFAHQERDTIGGPGRLEFRDPPRQFGPAYSRGRRDIEHHTTTD